MGLNCKIHRKGDEITKVVAPNGKGSLLFKNAVDFVKDKSRALRIWATAYIPEFKQYYGDWETDPDHTGQTLDENGEPILRDVQEFIDSSKTLAPPLGKEDVRDLQNFMNSTGINTISDLEGFLNYFVDGKKIVVDTNRLLRTGKYDVGEINRLMLDDGAYQNFVGILSKLKSYVLDSTPDARIAYLVENSSDAGIQIFKQGFDQLGKRYQQNPYQVQKDIMEACGGIKDRQEFDRALYDIGNEALSGMYEQDPEFANEIFERYSSLDRVRRVNADGSPAIETSLNEISRYSHPNAGSYTSAKSIVDAMLAIPTDMWEENSDLVRKGLKEVERQAATFGIDVVGLESYYESKTQAEFDDFLSSLDIFITSLNSSEDADYQSFSEDYNTFFGVGSTEISDVLKLTPNERRLNMVSYKDKGVTDIELYQQGLLHVRGNLYQKTEVRPREELYSTLESIIDAYPQILPKKAYGDPSNISRPALEAYINSFVSSAQNEDMVLNKAIYGHRLEEDKPVVDEQRELNRYYKRKSAPDLYEALIRARDLILGERIKGTPISDIVSYFNFGGSETDVTLKYDDIQTLKQIELELPEGKLKTALFDLAMSSNDPTMKNLFFLENLPGIYKNMEFYQYLYRNNPGLVEEYKGHLILRPGGMIDVLNTSSNFIRIGSDIYARVAQNAEYSTYQNTGASASTTFGMDVTEMSKEATDLDSYRVEDLGVDSYEDSNYIDQVNRLSIIKSLEC